MIAITAITNAAAMAIKTTYTLLFGGVVRFGADEVDAVSDVFSVEGTVVSGGVVSGG